MNLSQFLEGDQGADLEGAADAGTPETGEAVDAAPEQEGQTVGAEGDSGGAVETPAAAEDAFTGIDPNTLPPELQAIYKSLQGDYTRKTQQLAEMRRAMEGDPIAQAVQAVRQLAETDPQGLVNYLEHQLQQARAYAGQAEGQQAPEADGELEFDPEYMTPTEQRLYQQVQAMQQQLQAMQPVIQQTQFEKGLATLDAAFTNLETNVLGRKLSMEDRDAISAVALQMGVRSAEGLEAAAKAWDYNNAVKKGREEASRSVEQKRAMAPSGRPVAAGVGGSANPGNGRKSIGDLVELAYQGKLQ